MPHLIINDILGYIAPTCSVRLVGPFDIANVASDLQEDIAVLFDLLDPLGVVFQIVDHGSPYENNRRVGLVVRLSGPDLLIDLQSVGQEIRWTSQSAGRYSDGGRSSVVRLLPTASRRERLMALAIVIWEALRDRKGNGVGGAPSGPS